jgi:Leucine-rich repeat (LRR) protein
MTSELMVLAIAASTTLTNLTSLNLSGNSIGDDGAGYRCFHNLTNLTSLDLSTITSE